MPSTSEAVERAAAPGTTPLGFLLLGKIWGQSGSGRHSILFSVGNLLLFHMYTSLSFVPRFVYVDENIFYIRLGFRYES